MACSENFIVLDLEGFQSYNHKKGGFTYVLKELGYASKDFLTVGSLTFTPPHPFHQLNEKNQKTNAWLTRNRHGLRWNEGHIPYNHLGRILQSLTHSFSTIYVVGCQKAKFFAKALDYQKPVTEIYVPDGIIWKYREKCARHHHRMKYFNCAENKVRNYRWHIMEGDFHINHVYPDGTEKEERIQEEEAADNPLQAFDKAYDQLEKDPSPKAYDNLIQKWDNLSCFQVMEHPDEPFHLMGSSTSLSSISSNTSRKTTEGWGDIPENIPHYDPAACWNEPSKESHETPKISSEDPKTKSTECWDNEQTTHDPKSTKTMSTECWDNEQTTHDPKSTETMSTECWDNETEKTTENWDDRSQKYLN